MHQLPCFYGMSMLCQQQWCKPLVASNQVPGGLWWHLGSRSSYIFQQYSLSKMLPELCHLLLQKSGTQAVQGRKDPPPQTSHPNLGLVC